jgi:molybdopterin synthase sulfur carrier subunit
MKIELRLFASLSRYRSADSESKLAQVIEIPEGSTIGSLIEFLRIPADATKMVFINGIHAHDDDAIHEGDRVGIFPPIAGG